MARQLLKNEAAEQEANDVAFKFMNSADVVGDMKRAYTGRLDRVRLHDDDSADAKVSAAGRDGIASGSDIYLKKGLLSDSAPETKGLIAHEMTHIMQQSGGESTQESVSYGEKQGGIRDWFKKKFGKKEPETLTPKQRAARENEARMTEFAESLGDEGIANLDISGPTLQSITANRPSVDRTQLDQFRSIDVSKLSGEGFSDELKYQDFIASDHANGQINRELARDPKIQERALTEFITTYRKQMDGKSRDEAMLALRSSDKGSNGLAHVLAGLMPQGFREGLYSLGQTGLQGTDVARTEQVRNDRTPGRLEQELASEKANPDGPQDLSKMEQTREQAYSMIQHVVEKNGSEVGDMLTRAGSGLFDGMEFRGEEMPAEMQSAAMMNMLVNRVISPRIDRKSADETDQTEADKLHGFSGWLLSGTKFGSDLEGNRNRRFLSTLKKRLSKS